MSTAVHSSSLSPLRVSLHALREQTRTTLNRAGLTAGSTWRQLTDTFPSMDRGSAQRLLRFLRWPDDLVRSVRAMPGPHAWSAFLADAEKQLSDSDPDVVKLRHSIDEFVKQVSSFGGSFSAMQRAVAAIPDKEIEAAAQTAVPYRQAAFESFVNLLGYSCDVRVDIHLSRINPDNPRRMDHASAFAFVGLRGRRDATPMVMSFWADPLEPAEQHRAPWSRLLRHGTSRPVPDILLLTEGRGSTAMLQSDWMSRYQSLDLATLQVQPESSSLLWESPSKVLTGHTVNLHPCRRLVMDRMWSTRCPEPETFECAGVRIRLGEGRENAHAPWFDRIDDRIETSSHRLSEGIPRVEGCPEYEPMLREALDRLGWEEPDFTLHRGVVDHPIMLAEYVTIARY